MCVLFGGLLRGKLTRLFCWNYTYMYTYMYIYIYTHTHTYIHIYIMCSWAERVSMQ